MIKILLTGPAGCGKTTVIENLLDIFQGTTYGFITHEIKDDMGNRVGFEVENLRGMKRLLAHKYDIHSDFKVIGKSGIPFHVDIKTIDDFLLPEIRNQRYSHDLVIIDEIGKMQSLSGSFLMTVRSLFERQLPILATICFEPEPFSLFFKFHPEAILVEVSPQNRDILPEILHSIFTNCSYFEKLNEFRQIQVIQWAKFFFKENQYIQINKLFTKSLRYVVDRKIRKNTKSTFSVTGDHHKHIVQINPIPLTKSLSADRNYSCDCDMFLGKGIYQKKKGMCSHILASHIFSETNIFESNQNLTH